jgi:hypothetical protein
VILLGISAVTGATVVLELLLTRIFSVTLYYHFAFAVISLALFGLGASGIYLYIRRPSYPRAEAEVQMARSALLAALSAVFALVVVLRTSVPGHFSWKLVESLAVVYVVCAVPFFFAGLTVSLTIYHLRDEITLVYLYDLCGAGAGCVIAMALLAIGGAPSGVLATAALLSLAGLPFSMRARRVGLACVSAALGVGLLLCAAVNARDPFLHVTSAKELDESKVVFERWNLFSRVTVERVRQADRPYRWMRIDSSAATRIWSGAAVDRAIHDGRHPGPDGKDSYFLGRHHSLAYLLGDSSRPVLVIGPGGGADIASALVMGKRDVRGVELNPIIVDRVMRGAFARWSGDLYRRPGVRVEVGEGRSFVRRSRERYGVIQATLVDTWAATSSGAFTLSENNLYTLEAFEDFLEHLTRDGILTMTRWDRHPELTRLLVLARRALEHRGLARATDAARHFWLAGDGRTVTMLVKRTPFSAGELARLREHDRRNGHRIVFDPDTPRRHLYHTALRTRDLAGFIAAAQRDLSPPTDDRPFFFYSIRPDRVADTLARYRHLGGQDLGFFLLSTILGVVTVLVVALMVVPLIVFRRRDLAGATRDKVGALVLFVGLGLGFIIVEMSLMQRFVLFLGHPVHALSVVLFTLLVMGGIGSHLSGRVSIEKLRRWTLRSIGVLLGVLLALGVGLGPLFHALVGLPFVARVALSIATIAPLALLMGRMLPSGVRLLSIRHAEVIPWCWGMNGAASVLGSVLAMALAMNLGFNATLGAGMTAYALAGAALWRLRI